MHVYNTLELEKNHCFVKSSKFEGSLATDHLYDILVHLIKYFTISDIFKTYFKFIFKYRFQLQLL